MTSSYFKITGLDHHFKFTKEMSRLQQLDKVHKISSSYIPILYPPQSSGPISITQKQNILQHFADRLNKTISVTNTSIDIKSDTPPLLDLLFEIHIHSAAFLYDRLENVDICSVQQAGRQLFEKKNADYGDAFATYGVVGVLIRMQDKLSRYINLFSKKSTSFPKVSTETLIDTLIDLNNYAAMAIMLLFSVD